MGEQADPVKIVESETGLFVIRHGPAVLTEYRDTPSAKAFRDAYEVALKHGLSAADAFKRARNSAANPDLRAKYSDVPDEQFIKPGVDLEVCRRCLGELDSASGACPRCEPGKFRLCGICRCPVWQCCC